MTKFTVKKAGYQAVTCVSDDFIENCMPAANGEYVKIYLYLICCLKNEKEISVSSMADLFQCTESDIRRALKHWEKTELLELDTDESGEILSLTLKDRMSAPETSKIRKRDTSFASAVPLKAAPEKKNYTPAQTAVFKNRADMKQLLFVCEQYIGKTLSASDVQTIFYFNEELHFSADLIEYLVEYSVSKGKRSLRYMEKVALAWHEKGITSVEEAKMDSKAYARECYQVLKALGVNNHDPLPTEADYVSRWTKEFGFTMDIILEACNRTIMQIHKPEFKYVDKILSEWFHAGVRHLNDIAALDERHLTKAAAKPEEAQKAFTTRLHNFDQRTYDFNELEKKLFINS